MYTPSTLVGLRHPEMALQAAFRTGSMFEAWDDLLQIGDAYSAEEEHIARAVVQIVLASVPQLGLANILSMLFLAPVFPFVLVMWFLHLMHRSSSVFSQVVPSPVLVFPYSLGLLSSHTKNTPV